MATNSRGEHSSTPSPGSAEPGASDLARLRTEIDRVDRSLLAALNERAGLVRQVGELKERSGFAVYSAARERDLVRALVDANAGPFPNEGIAPVFREIVSATRSLEERVRVAYLGPEGTFAHEAARRQVGACADLLPIGTIPEVFAAVERGEVDYGVVPIENTIQGVVTPTFDTLVETEVAICGEILLRVCQQLLSRSGRLEDVRRVASHPQALAQCRAWLARNLPGAEQIETASTAVAAGMAADDGTLAAIGSAAAADTYGLEHVARDIEDHRANTTRFLLIGNSEPPPSGNDLTSAVFTVRKAQSGALHHLLEPFARNGVNLTSIQSRPMPGKPWEYLFYLDLEGHQADASVAVALEQAAAAAHSHRVLGSFPRASNLQAGD